MLKGGAGTKETCILLLKHRAMLIDFSSSFVYLGRELERNGKARRGSNFLPNKKLTPVPPMMRSRVSVEGLGPQPGRG